MSKETETNIEALVRAASEGVATTEQLGSLSRILQSNLSSTLVTSLNNLSKDIASLAGIKNRLVARAGELIEDVFCTTLFCLRTPFNI